MTYPPYCDPHALTLSTHCPPSLHPGLASAVAPTNVDTGGVVFAGDVLVRLPESVAVAARTSAATTSPGYADVGGVAKVKDTYAVELNIDIVASGAGYVDAKPASVVVVM